MLSIVVYYYFALSGNPLIMWQQKRAVVKIYEERYQEPFDVTDSNYDYKRGEYKVEIAPENNPEYEFETTLYEASQIDLYAKLRTINYLREQVNLALDSEYSDLEYTFNVFEDYRSTGLMETDMMKRLSQNMYNIDFYFDVESIDVEKLNSIFIGIHTKIEKKIDVPIGEMTLRFGAYDGTNYHHFELSLDKYANY